MIDNKFQDIPVIARRLAHDELVARIASLESELAEAQTGSQRLADLIATERAEFEATLALHIAVSETLRAQLEERTAMFEARESAFAELEVRLASVTSELKAVRAEHAVMLQAMRADFEVALTQQVAAEQALRAEWEGRLAAAIAEHEAFRIEQEQVQSAAQQEFKVARAQWAADHEALRAEWEGRLAAAIAEHEAFRIEQEQLQSAAQQVFEVARAQWAADHEALRAELEAGLASAIAEHEASLAEQVRLRQIANDEFEAASAAQAETNESLRIALENWERQARHHDRMREEQEITTCRKIADRCLFIVGFARSNTTITLEMLNCADNALLLGEAQFFLQDHGPRFSDWYNDQHKGFLNQVTKSSYAPDFLPNGPHEWWEWLDHASQFFECIGEKIALSHYHLKESPPDAFRAFHEARFLSSRYIFMLRNPVDVLLSSAKLMGISTDEDMTVLCIAWLDYMQLWSDSIRVFPRTTTLVVERFSEETVADLEAFTGLDLGDARLLISPANRRVHRMTPKFPTLGRFRAELEAIYADALQAIDENRALWQAEQKRTPAANDTAGNAAGMVAMTSRPLGRLWLKIQALRETLSAIVKEDTSDV